MACTLTLQHLSKKRNCGQPKGWPRSRCVFLFVERLQERLDSFYIPGRCPRNVYLRSSDKPLTFDDLIADHDREVSAMKICDNLHPPRSVWHIHLYQCPPDITCAPHGEF